MYIRFLAIKGERFNGLGESVMPHGKMASFPVNYMSGLPSVLEGRQCMIRAQNEYRSWSRSEDQ